MTGWSYDGTSDPASHINLWVGKNLSDSNSLRFASDTWYKNHVADYECQGEFHKEKDRIGH